MKIEQLRYVYFIGIGGIGMSALARYFIQNNIKVAGYDKTSTDLTESLKKEGIKIHYEDNILLIPEEMRDIKNKEFILVVYTPAVPSNHNELIYFTEKGFYVEKRAKVLGYITQSKNCIAIAGTHGKTTISTFVAHFLYKSSLSCNAFLGGISKNYNTNLLLKESENVVVEADEYDRSFLNLYPDIALVTAMDVDHLDIFGTEEEMKKSFQDFVNQIKEGGILITKYGLNLKSSVNKVKHLSYSVDNKKADFYAQNIRLENGLYVFDFVAIGYTLRHMILGLPGYYNLENAIAALSVAYLSGSYQRVMRENLESFMGVKRRFDFHIRSEKIIFIDDYAHHPEEIAACLKSAKELYPDKKITGIFQPHLYSRTRDLADDFAKSLSMLDNLFLLNIYPAREEPIEGITSDIIFKNVKCESKKTGSKEELIAFVNDIQSGVIITMGAGDIDRMVEPIKDILLKKLN